MRVRGAGAGELWNRYRFCFAYGSRTTVLRSIRIYLSYVCICIKSRGDAFGGELMQGTVIHMCKLMMYSRTVQYNTPYGYTHTHGVHSIKGLSCITSTLIIYHS